MTLDMCLAKDNDLPKQLHKEYNLTYMNTIKKQLDINIYNSRDRTLVVRRLNGDKEEFQTINGGRSTTKRK